MVRLKPPEQSRPSSCPGGDGSSSVHNDRDELPVRSGRRGRRRAARQRRGSVGALLTGSLFGVSAIATFQAIAWMLRSYEGPDDRLGQVAALLRFSAAGIAVVQLWVTIADVQAQYGSSNAAFAGMLAFFTLGLVLIGVLAFRWATKPGHPPPLDAWWAAPALIGHLLFVVLAFDINASASTSEPGSTG